MALSTWHWHGITMNTLKPARDIHRFLFSSPASFVGHVETETYLLMPAFPSGEDMRLFCTQGPYQRSFVSATLQIPEDEPAAGEPPVRNNYCWLADQLAGLLCAYYGKLIVNHGYTNWGDIFSVPQFGFVPTVDYSLPPFDGKPRAATRLPDLNLAHSARLLSGFMLAKGSDELQTSAVNASAFYQQALTLYSQRPHLSFTLLLICLECLLPLGRYADEDVYCAELLDDLSAITAEVEGGAEIVKRLKSRLFQIRRKCALFVHQTLDGDFYQSSESELNLRRASAGDIQCHIKAAYDLRSRFMHTGRSHGVWVNAMKHVGEELVSGDPVIHDPDLKKLVVNSLTLFGLERVVQYCLHRSIISTIKVSPAQPQ